MSEDNTPTRSPTLTDLIQGGDAHFRLATFKTMMQQARAYQIVLKNEGTITDDECTSIIQGYGHIEDEIVQDNSFCCGDCGEGALHFFSDNDGTCVWCLEAHQAEQPQKCEHLNYADTLDGAQCLDCDEKIEAENEDSGASSCCDFHHAEKDTEGADKLPCATWQGGSNYAPNFGEGAQGEGEYDHENDLFKSHILHLIEPLHMASILMSWDGVDCPSCGVAVEFEQEGDSVRADCFQCEVGATLGVWV